ncbi:MAG: limonene-1,2-epoxide hydrolase family protein [Acidimicrobiales bacterium]|nr:limonene-1,2-epoxide hydrolase family protein [Acidimicrobiales bacterium]
MSKSTEILETFLASMQSCDIDKVMGSFTNDSLWQNVPHLPAKGLIEIRTMFETIMRRSSKIRWDVVSASFNKDQAWIERVDRFWIDGTEYAVKCNGVFDFDSSTSTIQSVRDYVDLGEWRSRLSQAQL